MVRLTICVAALAVLLGCDSIKHEAVDTKPPNVVITAPPNNSYTGGDCVYIVKVNAYDENGLWKVHFRRRDVYGNSDPELDLDWDDYSEPWEAGMYDANPPNRNTGVTIYATAYDHSGNEATTSISLRHGAEP